MNRKMMARYFIFAVLIASAALSFAGQQGLPIGGRLIDHQHTTYGDGGILQGLSPVGNFYIFGNNAGNIQISTSITGRLFAWKPASGTFIAGESTDDSFYTNNLGKYSWIGGYNSTSPGDYSMSFGTYTKNNRAASILLGYWLKNNAGNSVMIGSGPGFGPQPYAVNDDTGSIKFFPFTTTSETRPMLNLKRDGTGEFVGVLNFTSTPTINGIELSTAVTTDNSKVLKTGDTMTGDLLMTGVGLHINRAPRASSVISIASASANIFLETVDNSATGPAIFIQKNRGVDVSSAVKAIAGDTIGAIHFRPQQNDYPAAPSYPSSAIIRATLEAGAAGLNDMPSRLEFMTAADGTANSVERVRITGEGRVGISTGAPQATLDVNGVIYSTGIYSTGQATVWAMGNSYPQSNLILPNYSNASRFYILNAEGTLFISGDSATDFLTLSPTGKLGIGTASATSALHVMGLAEYADNAAALAAGLTAGAFYRTGDDLKVVH